MGTGTGIRKCTKGQVALEFLMYAGLFMIIMIAAYVLTTFTERGEISLRESQMANSFGYKFAYSPTVAYKGGEGFTYDILFQKELDSRLYNVTYVCSEDSEGLRSCTAFLQWKGMYGEYYYPYTIAPAYYEIKDHLCLKDVSSSTKEGILLDPSRSDGHLIFRNIGYKNDGDEYPTIELYCSLP